MPNSISLDFTASHVDGRNERNDGANELFKPLVAIDIEKLELKIIDSTVFTGVIAQIEKIEINKAVDGGF